MFSFIIGMFDMFHPLSCMPTPTPGGPIDPGDDLWCTLFGIGC
jgi:hypothetical protein